MNKVRLCAPLPAALVIANDAVLPDGVPVRDTAYVFAADTSTLAVVVENVTDPSGGDVTAAASAVSSSAMLLWSAMCPESPRALVSGGIGMRHLGIRWQG